MNDKLTAWQHCCRLWAEHMRIESADRGYDFKAGAAARDAYIKARVAYAETHGEDFNPERRP